MGVGSYAQCLGLMGPGGWTVLSEQHKVHHLLQEEVAAGPAPRRPEQGPPPEGAVGLVDAEFGAGVQAQGS